MPVTDPPPADTTPAGDGIPGTRPPEAGTPERPGVDVWLVTVTAFAVAAGVVLRLWPRSGLWLDEALTANISALPVGDIGDALRIDGHPPLYYWLVNLWGRLGQSDTWLRSLSAVIGIVGLPLVYLCGTRLADRNGAGPAARRRIGLIALTLAAILPFGVRYGSELRMYSLVITLSAAGYLLIDDLLRARSDGPRRTLTTVGTAVVAAALLWSHYWSIWLLAAVGAIAAFQLWRDDDDRRRSGAVHVLGALVVGGLAFLPWLPTMLYQAANTGTPWGERFLPLSVIVVTLVDTAGGRFGAAQFLSYAMVTFVLMALFVRVGRDDDLLIAARPTPRILPEMATLAIAMGLGAMTAIASGNTFASRYASIGFVLLVLCIAAGVALLRSATLTATLLAVMVALSVYGGWGEATSNRSQSGEVAEAIVADLQERGDPPGANAVVISCPDQLAVSLQRELDQARDDGSLGELGDVVAFPDAGDPRFVDWVDYLGRNADVSGEEFVERIGDRVEDGSVVYLYSSVEYRGVESVCNEVLGALAPARPVEQLVVGDPASNYEFGDLRVLGPRS